MKDSGVKIYDIECLSNFFCYCDIDRDTEKKHTFVIHQSRNQLKELLDYLEGNIIKHVGYNNLNYDSQVIQYIIDYKRELLRLDGDTIGKKIKQFSDKVIKLSNDKQPLPYREWLLKIDQLDLYRIWHFDNKAKATRLKDLQVAMKWKRVKDMPLHHTHEVSEHEIDLILDYCDNDIMSTFEFYKKSREKIDLRITLGKKYGINLINANDGKIGTEIFLKILSERKNISKYDLKKLRTFREEIPLKDCILDIVKFNSREFNNILDEFKSIVLTKDITGLIKTKNVLDLSGSYKGFTYDYGLGGIHGCTDPGIYSSDDKSIIKSCDVTSLYPMIGITRRFYPEHLGEDFVPVYNGVFDDRSIAKKKYKSDKTDLISKATNEGLKYALNIPYGKSNEADSFLYDPKYTMQITINGQLMLSMLAEKLSDAGFRILMINTDGLECIVPRDEVDIYNSICEEWEKLTKLSLEFVDYKKMIIRDVNNYIAIDDRDEVKYKGCFEVVKDYHKDPSFPIVPIALSEYFVYGIPIEETVKNINKEYLVFENGENIKKKINIFDYAGRAKFKSDSKGELRTIGYSNGGPRLVSYDLQKTTRYLVTKTGGSLVKVFYDGRQSFINKGFQCSEFNDYDEGEIQRYDLDYQFYIDECYKIKDVVEPSATQGYLF